MINLVDERLVAYDTKAKPLELSLNLDELNTPSLKSLIASSTKNSPTIIEQLEALENFDENGLKKNLDRTAWTISAGLLAAGMQKLITLGYISPEIALVTGVAIGGTLLTKEIYKFFSKDVF